MSGKKVLDIVKDYLKDCKLMQVSVSINNRPRIFNCWFSYDKNWNFYYISPPSADHSKIILNNPEVGVSIVSPQMSTLGVGPHVQGLMFGGTAKKVEGRELISAYKNFLSKYPKVMKYIKLVGKKVVMDGTAIYRITPKSAIWFDNVNFREAKQKVVLK